MNPLSLSSSRSRRLIVELLRREPMTVNRLAASLSLTDNAVRASLSRLERDGLVRKTGEQPSARRPESVYGLTAQAEGYYAKAYAPLTVALLDSIKGGGGSEAAEENLKEAGRRLAEPHLAAMQGLPEAERGRRTAKILQDLGGLAQLEERGGRLYIQGLSCPLAEAVRQHPETCLAAQALIGALTGMRVQERCEKGERPKCCFLLGDGENPGEAA